MSTPPLFRCDSGSLVVLDGRPRQSWRRTAPDEWRLEGIWPGPVERRRLHRAVRTGTRILVVLSSAGEHVDVYDEEISDQHSARHYTVCQDGGITSLYIPSLDWLPARVAQRGRRFLSDHERLHTAGHLDTNAALSPPLGSHRNLRVFLTPIGHETYLDPDTRNDLARLAFDRAS